MLPCPPAETAEINQYDLADALIDTEKSHREESLDPGTDTVWLFYTSEHLNRLWFSLYMCLKLTDTE